MAATGEARLVDVARLAGVSVATVSRVLNNRGYLSDETRERVQRAITTLDYRPNQVARSLLRSRTGTIGLIVPTVALPFFGEVAAGIEGELAERGYRLQLCNSLGHADREREQLNQLLDNRVDGIISGAHNDQLPEYQTIRQPVVTIDRELAPHIPNVRVDNEAGGVQATELLLRRGCRRPALLTSRSHSRNLRERGYRTVLARQGIDPVVVTAGFTVPGPERTREVQAALAAAPSDIDGVFATDDLLAALALEWAWLTDRSVPDDLRVIGFDGTAAVRQALPALSTVQQPIADLCRTAVSILLEQVEARGRGVPPQSTPVPAVELPVTVLEGRTT